MSVIEEIKQRLDIVELVSSYVPLTKAGRTYKGLCPFHSEKTPSFVVFPESQNWHCFGACGTGGDVFSFIMKREKLDFAEALKLLADKAGVELQPREGPPPAAEQQMERLREIVASAAGYFHYLLINAREASIARDYLSSRGLHKETWENWQLGYALDSWDALKNQLLRKGYSEAELEEAGLVIRRDEGSGSYDRFRGRLVIPIRDTQSRTIGFGARILKEDDGRPQPKYINSPQTPLFDKSKVLFGLDMARKAIRDAGLAVIVEGYMDVLASHQVGVRNVVAGMGTALTESQLRQLKRYSSNITLALDPDAAGDHATLRGLETARQTFERSSELVVGPRGLLYQESRLNAQLQIATLPDGLDPDELALSDPGRWQQVIRDAQPIAAYYLAAIGREEDLTGARGKANAVARMAPLLREIANPVERHHYLQLLARLIQTDERLVEQEVEALDLAARRERARGAASSHRAAGTSDAEAEPDSSGQPEEEAPAGHGKRAARSKQGALPRMGLEEHILGQLLLRPDLLARLDIELAACNTYPLTIQDFGSGENGAFLEALQALPVDADDLSLDDVLMHLPEALHARCRALYEWAQSYPMLTDEKLVKDLADSLLRLRARVLRQQVGQLQFLIMESEQTEQREQAHEYHKLMVSYTAQKLRLQKLLDARTMTGALKKQG